MRPIYTNSVRFVCNGALRTSPSVHLSPGMNARRRSASIGVRSVSAGLALSRSSRSYRRRTKFLRARGAFVSTLSCLCPRRLPDRAVDCEFGSAPYCVEPPKRGVERVLANGRFSLMRAPSLYPQSSSASRFTAGAAGFFILSQSGERPRASPRSRA